MPKVEPLWNWGRHPGAMVVRRGRFRLGLGARPGRVWRGEGGGSLASDSVRPSGRTAARGMKTGDHVGAGLRVCPG